MKVFAKLVRRLRFDHYGRRRGASDRRRDQRELVLPQHEERRSGISDRRRGDRRSTTGGEGIAWE